ncbi:Rhomboid-related protein 4 [Varanus komodoensis]|nr:Rhomboid-related protein 4 [Varanus komodoensis]
MQRRHKGLHSGLLLLFSQIAHVGINNIPPVTLATLAVNIFLFLQPLDSLNEACVSVNKVLYKGDWHPLYLSVVHHIDDWHLYFNMVSLLWKGMKLEKRLGSLWFGYIITLFSLLVGVVYILLELIVAELLHDPLYKQSCAVGFSGVLFALKVLNNYYHPGGSSNILGVNVSNKFACWVELVAIHFLNPGSGFRMRKSDAVSWHVRQPTFPFTAAGGGGGSNTQGKEDFFCRTSGRYSCWTNVHHGTPEDDHESMCRYRMISLVALSLQPDFQNTEMATIQVKNFSYSGYQFYPQRDYNLFTGGLSEEEQLRRAVINSLNDRGVNDEVAEQDITLMSGDLNASGFHKKNHQLRELEGKDLIDLRGGNILETNLKYMKSCTSAKTLVVASDFK